jgi:uncharacterized protein (TIGR02099 family)
VIKKIGLSAALVIAAAVLGAILLAPSLAQRHRADIEALAADFAGIPVAIGGVTLGWSGWRPQLRLRQFRLLDPVNGETAMQFDSVDLQLDPLASLAAWEVTPSHLALNGQRITLIRTPAGRIVIEGLDDSDSAFLPWLMQRPGVSIHYGQVIWHDQQRGRAPLVLSDVALSGENAGERHHLKGSMKLPGELGESLDLTLDATGDVFSGTAGGELFLDARGLRPAAALNLQPALGLDIAGGLAAARLRVGWSRGELTGVQGDFTGRSLDVTATVNPDIRLHVEEVHGHVNAARGEGGQWRVGLESFKLTTGHGQWPETQLSLTVSAPQAGADREIAGQAGFLRIEDIVPLVPGLAATGNDWSKLIQMQPRGDLRDLDFGFYPGRAGADRLSLRAQFEGLGGAPVGELPGFAGLTGYVEANGSEGLLRLAEAPFSFDAPTLFNLPLRLDSLMGELRWTRGGQGWSFQSSGLDLRNQDLALKLHGGIEINQEGKLVSDLYADLARFQAASLSNYLPLVVPVEARDWLKQAILGGNVHGGRMVLRGPLAQFPFDPGLGEFNISLQVRDGILHYSPGWPQIEDIETSLLFQGRKLTIQASTGRILGAAIHDVTTVLPNLGEGGKRVLVHGFAKGPVAEGFRFLANSPLRGQVGRHIDPLAVDGDFRLELGLNIPLGAEHETTVRAQVGFPGNTVKVKGRDILFQSFTGKLIFTEEEWAGQGIQARLFERPVRLDLEGDSRDAWLTIHGQADRGFLSNQLKTSSGVMPPKAAKFLQGIQGETSWTAWVDLARPLDHPDVTDNLKVVSDLSGLAIEAPAPLGKSAGTTRRFELITSLSKDAHRPLQLKLGDLSARIGWATDEVAHKQAAPATKRSRLQIGLTGSVDQLSLSEWMAYLDDGADAAAKPPPEAGPAEAEIQGDVRIARLEAFGHYFEHLRLKSSAAQGRWRFNVDGSSAKGQLRAARRAGEGLIVEADLDRLRLSQPKPASPGMDLNPGDLPTLSLHCKQFAFKSLELGEMHLMARPRAEGMEVAKLSLLSPAVTVNASGVWEVGDENQASRFDIDVTGPKLGDLLANFGYSTANLDGGRTAMGIHAHWPGTPADFALAKLNGSLKLYVTQGRLLDVENRVGRIFGLLSIYTLPRRLFLDFDDLFKKGFTFDKIEGLFRIEDGNAFTNDLFMEGPSARIEVTGRTGLAEQDYDQVITVTPALASSLPLASALFGPAGAGVGAAVFLAEQIFPAIPTQIDKVLSQQYAITGQWDAPVVRRYSAQAGK